MLTLVIIMTLAISKTNLAMKGGMRTKIKTSLKTPMKAMTKKKILMSVKVKPVRSPGCSAPYSTPPAASLIVYTVSSTTSSLFNQSRPTMIPLSTKSGKKPVKSPILSLSSLFSSLSTPKSPASASIITASNVSFRASSSQSSWSTLAFSLPQSSSTLAISLVPA